MYLLEDLFQLLGKGNVLTGDDCAPFEQDWRKRFLGKALAVARPGTTEEVAAVVKLCAAASVSIVPQGGNTGLCGGATPNTSGKQLILSLSRMNRIRSIDTANDTLIAEAGCVLQTVQAAAEQAQRYFPLSLAAEGSCSIGGNLATNAGGTGVLRYGNARELCLGLEVVTADGEIWHGLRGLRKDNTGYDLRDLFIGSEGTLGIITAAVLKLYPEAAERNTSWVTTNSIANCVALLALAKQRLGPTLTGFEIMNANALRLVQAHMPQLTLPIALDAKQAGNEPYAVLLECSDHEGGAHAQTLFQSLLEAAFEQGLVHDAAVSTSMQQRAHMWHIRESIPLAQAQEGLNIKHDISLPISAIPEFVETTSQALGVAFPGAQLVNFGHLGDGNLHFNLQAARGANAAEFLASNQARCNSLVHDAVHFRGGSFSAEHGVGQLKASELARYKSPLELALMQRVKTAFDPTNLLNPDKVLSA
jgi:FAD/FMN-containing dehydrogenase